MGIIYAKFDVGFPDDPKVIEAGDLAELCYVRCVLRGRDSLCDGVIHRSRLPRWLAGIRGKQETHMAKLVEVGLLLVHPDGWQFPEQAWRRWNPLASEIDEKRAEEADRKKAYREKRRASESVPVGHSRDSLSRPDVSETPEEEKRKRRGREEEEEEEEKRRGREEEESSSSPSDSSRHLTAVSDDDEDSLIAAVITNVAERRADSKSTSSKPGYTLVVAAELMDSYRDRIRDFIRARPDVTDPNDLGRLYESHWVAFGGRSA